MGEVTQDVTIEMLEKLADGNYKRKNLKAANVKMADNTTVEEKVMSHLTDKANPHGTTKAKNLLHNWDFRNPVNQRGVSGTISTAGYFLDRWKLISGTVTINSGSITLNGTIAQILEVKAGTNTKASTLCQSGTATASYNDSTKTFTLTSSGGILLSAKLEIGSTSTLANDPPADYGEQLALCQRYQLKFGAIARYRACQIASNVIDFFIPTPTTIRVNPTINTDAISVMNLNGTARTGFTFTTHNAVDSLNGFVIRCIKTGHGMTDAILSINTGTIIDANL
jgi:hypothetical protein